MRLVDPTQLGHIDLLIGGSPCQSFSFAGKRVGMATKENEKVLSLDRYLELKELGFEFEGQSYLFWEYMRILTELRRLNPNIKFLLENVKMKKEWERVLTEAIGVEGVHINSALVSAQNRKRIYWTNIGQIAQPEDRGLLLRDILQTEVDEKYYISEKMTAWLLRHSEKRGCKMKGYTGENKSGTITATAEYKGNLCTNWIKEDNYLKISRKGEVRKDQDKASCLTVGGHGAGNHSDMDLIACLTPKRTDYGKAIRKQYESGAVHEQRKNMTQLEPRNDGKTNTLTTVQKDNLLLTSEPRIRRLTPTECARLQTIPDWYRWEGTSETQQYRMLGNGWTVEVIKHIFSYL